MGNCYFINRGYACACSASVSGCITVLPAEFAAFLNKMYSACATCTVHRMKIEISNFLKKFILTPTRFLDCLHSSLFLFLGRQYATCNQLFTCSFCFHKVHARKTCILCTNNIFKLVVDHVAVVWINIEFMLRMMINIGIWLNHVYICRDYYIIKQCEDFRVLLFE